jgi:hypothetical protein
MKGQLGSETQTPNVSDPHLLGAHGTESACKVLPAFPLLAARCNPCIRKNIEGVTTPTSLLLQELEDLKSYHRKGQEIFLMAARSPMRLLLEPLDA